MRDLGRSHTYPVSLCLGGVLLGYLLTTQIRRRVRIWGGSSSKQMPEGGTKPPLTPCYINVPAASLVLSCLNKCRNFFYVKVLAAMWPVMFLLQHTETAWVIHSTAGPCLAALTAPLMTRGQISPSTVSPPKMNMNVIDTWVLPASENKLLWDYKKENLKDLNLGGTTKTDTRSTGTLSLSLLNGVVLVQLDIFIVREWMKKQGSKHDK